MLSELEGSNANSAKRVLIIAPTAYPLGGVAVWLDYLLSGLTDLGSDVWLGAVHGEHHNSQDYLAHYPCKNNVTIMNDTGTAYGRVLSLITAIESVRPDLVLCVNIPDVYRAAREMRKAGKFRFQVASTIHGLVPSLFQDITSYADVIDHVIVTNQLTRLMVLETTPVSEAQLHYAPYGVSMPKNLRAIDTTQKTREPLRILYCGRVENQQKRCADIVAVLFELARLSVNFEFRIAGDGPWKTEMLRQLEPIESQVDVIDFGVVPASELDARVYSNSDVLLLTSEWETGPIVVWEAMAAGVAVVSSRYHGSGSEAALSDEHNCLMFDVGDVKTVAAQLARLCDASLRKKLVEQGFSLVSSRYTKDISVATWQTVLNHILSSAPSNRALNPQELRYPNQGRLDRFLGYKYATLLRSILKIPIKYSDAGGEWPHTHSQADNRFNAEFFDTINRVERKGS